MGPEQVNDCTVTVWPRVMVVLLLLLTRLGLAVVVVRRMCRLATWQVKEVVQCFGDLKGFHLLVDPQEVGKNRGVAFLEYAQPEQTEQASATYPYPYYTCR